MEPKRDQENSMPMNLSKDSPSPPEFANSLNFINQDDDDDLAISSPSVSSKSKVKSNVIFSGMMTINLQLVSYPCFMVA